MRATRGKEAQRIERRQTIADDACVDIAAFHEHQSALLLAPLHALVDVRRRIDRRRRVEVVVETRRAVGAVVGRLNADARERLGAAMTRSIKALDRKFVAVVVDDAARTCSVFARCNNLNGSRMLMKHIRKKKSKN